MIKKNYKDLIGQRFGRLVVLKYAYTQKKHAYWLCKCDCGNEKIVASSSLIQGVTKSCGCLNIEKIKSRRTIHKKTDTRIYKIWECIKYRCTDKNNKLYGCRGITVCEEWKNDFISFYEWSMANGYADNLTIDRIDVNGNYEPNNCRWVSNIIQQNNKRNNYFIKFNGEIHTLSEWCKKLNLPYKVIHCRIKRQNWDIKRAFLTPIRSIHNV